MRTLLGVLTAMSLAVATCAFAAEETLLQVSSLGHVAVTFADGVKAEMLPVIEGTHWAYSDGNDGAAAKGEATDLFRDGLTVTVPVRGEGGTKLSIAEQCSIDKDDPCVILFRYRFTAPETTKLNAARLTLNLPIKPYQGLPVSGVGAATSLDKLPLAPLQGGHLLNGMAKGVEIGGVHKHGFRIELDQPAWCLVDDERSWKREDRYSIQLCALVSADGTTLEAGKSVEVSGTIGFDAPVRVEEDRDFVKGPKEAVDKGALTVSEDDPSSPCLVDRAGAKAVRIETWLWATGGNTRPEPAPPVETDPGWTHGRLWADRAHTSGLDLMQHLIGKPGELDLKGKVTAAAAMEFNALTLMVSLSVPHFEDCAAAADDAGKTTVPLRGGAGAPVVRIPAAGTIRIQRDGKTVLEFVADRARRWELWRMGEQSVVLIEWLVDRSPTGAPNRAGGDVCEHTLTCRWGQGK